MSEAKSAALLSRKIPTGVPGLDEILHGGLPCDRLYLLEGYPGTGKTTLALQFLLEGVRQKEKVLYVTLSETNEEITQVAASHGWSLEGIDLFELSALEGRFKEQKQYSIFPASEVELGETTQKIFARIRDLQPSRIVFDSLSEMRLLAGEALRYRRQILSLKQFLTEHQSTVLLLDDQTSEATDLQLQSICHGVIILEEQPTDNSGTRSHLRVVKLRGSDFEKGHHDYVIHYGGVIAYPRLVAANERLLISGNGHMKRSCRSGVAAMDTLLGGGLEYGSSTLLLGPAGAGKSSIATQFLCNAATAGDRGVCYLFEESCHVFLERAGGLGQNLEPLIDQNLLRIQQVDPTRLSPGEFMALVRREVENHKATIIVIDSLNGYLNAMPSEKHLLLKVHELLMYLDECQAMTMMLMAQHGMMGNTMTQPMDVSYMADTVILLRYFEAMGKVRKAISVVKKRMGAHENSIREFRLSSQGVQIGAPLYEFQGVLSGIPHFIGTSSQLMKENVGDN